jgi:hypothetical protein
MSIETLCNIALDHIGYKRHIGNINEGSDASTIALNLWAQARDSLLFDMAPHWARKDATLTLLKSAPNISGPFTNYDITPWTDNFPPIPWLYEYILPSDNIKPLSIKQTPITGPLFMPRAIPFQHRVVSSTSETLTCNVTPAICTYIYRVTNPDLWHQDFQDKMILALAKQFTAELGKMPPQPRGQQSGDTPN